jgi:hypothetical protein
VRVNCRWSNIKEICGRVEGFSPEFRRHRRLNKESVSDVIKSTERMLGLAVLRGGIIAGETQDNSILKKEILIFRVVKFTTIIALNKSYRKEKVDRDIALKIKKYIVNIGFIA